MDDVTVISFDADGTLWDFESMMRASLGVTLSELERVRGDRSGLNVETMIEIMRDPDLVDPRYH